MKTRSYSQKTRRKACGPYWDNTIIFSIFMVRVFNVLHTVFQSSFINHRYLLRIKNTNFKTLKPVPPAKTSHWTMIIDKIESHGAINNPLFAFKEIKKYFKFCDADILV